jgi:hypothetical protein
MTVTKNEFGQMNMFAKEPAMYMTEEDIERYGIEPYAEKAEKMNGRWAMLGYCCWCYFLCSHWKPFLRGSLRVDNDFTLVYNDISCLLRIAGSICRKTL